MFPLPGERVSMIAVDEACYIPLWGQSFRPAFQDLSWLREAPLVRRGSLTMKSRCSNLALSENMLFQNPRGLPSLKYIYNIYIYIYIYIHIHNYTYIHIYIYTYHLYDHFPTTMTGCCQDAPFRDPHFGRIPKVRGRAHLSPLGHSASQAAELHSSLLEAAESASMLDRKIWENSLG